MNIILALSGRKLTLRTGLVVNQNSEVCLGQFIVNLGVQLALNSLSNKLIWRSKIDVHVSS